MEKRNFVFCIRNIVIDSHNYGLVCNFWNVKGGPYGPTDNLKERYGNTA